MFFGTTTTTGIKVGFTTGLPDSFVFGFRRKEFSYIPLGGIDVNGQTHDVYPSVLASIDTAANVSADGKTSDTALANSQFFATGQAARQLAATPGITGGFKSIASEVILKQQALAVTGAQSAADSTDTLLDSILTAFSGKATTAQQKASIVAAAQQAGMDPDNSMTVNNFTKKLTAFSSTVPAAQAQKNLQALLKQINALLAR